MSEIALSSGHTEIIQKADDLQVEAIHGGMAVRLHASLRYHPSEGALGPGRHLRATTLAIHMDRKAAIELSAKLTDLIRSMGWQQPSEAGYQD